ncbi:uncharacterized protein LOC108220727 isoform X1 [Daucus carota subsp. sativus]|uniref:uncharacterized protein LOC108220727 isoform X1 n=1 Tax=Daucus carota subsp. sativus TaxID=79200 RepID=UPI003083831C
MGQSLKKQGNGEETLKEKEIRAITEKCYDAYFADPDKDYSSAEFFFAVSRTVEEINKMIGSTQIRVPSAATLEDAFNICMKERILCSSVKMLKRLMEGEDLFDLQKYHQDKGKALTKEEFQKILQAVILDTGVSGMGAKDMLLYIFGVPLTAVFLKQQIIPGAIRNDVFIPAVTSATVFLLAKLNKI